MRFAPLSRPFRRPAFLAALLLGLAPGLAMAGEKVTEIFVVDSSDGYGIDSCVASGAPCGQAMADAWCRVHNFERATGFGKVQSDAAPRPATAARATPVRTACYGAGCTETVAITCTR